MISLMQAGGASSDSTAIAALIVSVLSAVVALVAAVFGGLSYQANKRMAVANETMAATNQGMAQSADVSAKAARDAVEVQRRAEQLAKKACLHLAVDQGHRGYEFFEEETPVQDDEGKDVDTGWIGFYLRNEGQFPAMNCQLSLRDLDAPAALKIKGEGHRRIGPGEVERLGFVVPYLPLTEDDDEVLLSARVDFEDGLGQDTLFLGIRFFSTIPLDHSSKVPWGFRMMPEMESRSWLCRPPEEDESWN